MAASKKRRASLKRKNGYELDLKNKANLSGNRILTDIESKRSEEERQHPGTTYTGPPVKFLPPDFHKKAEQRAPEIHSRQRSQKDTTKGLTESSRPMSRENFSLPHVEQTSWPYRPHHERRGSQPIELE